jgi:hypothetical protein
MNNIWPRLTKVNLFILIIGENDLNEVSYLMQFNTNKVVIKCHQLTQYESV